MPSVLEQHEQLVLLDGVDENGLLRILDPELGPLHVPLAEMQVDECGSFPPELLGYLLNQCVAPRLGEAMAMPVRGVARSRVFM